MTYFAVFLCNFSSLVESGPSAGFLVIVSTFYVGFSERKTPNTTQTCVNRASVREVTVQAGQGEAAPTSFPAVVPFVSLLSLP